ncbi:dynamin family protein [Pseudonocardia kujensis]|uniref:dynamin family protein n=1 Tax=Pseudonocardia kujensis TaxID=1128675 RepID=UPI001E389CBC|nr:dynamin family protein [Pseudonocardia kujensis]MCE0768537.1 dynamin family protein [Pseudonocardia kujensis]
MSGSGVAERIAALVQAAIGVYTGGPAEAELRAVADRLAEPLRVAIAGRVKAGKSTLLNALVGQQLAATDAGECTRIVTWYVDGLTYRVDLHPREGASRQVPFRRVRGALDIRLDGVTAAEVERLVVQWPAPALRTMSLIDTPGMGSATTALGERTEALLTPEAELEGAPAEVDAVVYLMRHVHGEDVRFLETFQDGSPDRNPVNTVGVLARADEVGHARPDALEVAGRIATRYAADPRIRALCRTVVPVAGLLASAAAALRESEYRMIEVLARAPDLDRLLLTADRLLTAPTDVPLLPDERAALLDRFGMFGLRLATRMVRDGEVGGARGLAAALAEASGLPLLQAVLADQFAARAEVLKARSALMALEAVVRRYPPPAASGLARDVERVRAEAHEFAEIALLDAVRSGAVPLSPDEASGAELLLGASGTDARSRLGLAADAGPEQVRKAAADQHLRWQLRAEHPASPREVRQAARLLVRSCEGILGGLGPG